MFFFLPFILLKIKPEITCNPLHTELRFRFSIEKEFFSHSSVQNSSDISSVAKDRIGKISYKAENPIFKTKKLIVKM